MPIKSPTAPARTILPELLTGRDAAAYLSISVVSLYRLSASGGLPRVRVGAGATRWRRSDLEAYVRNLKAQ